jgi:uncharacterized membrane protein YhiD involved in acid resistance
MNQLDLFDYIQTNNVVITAGTVILNMVITTIVAIFIFWVYKKTYSGVLYSRSFNITLLLTSMVTAMVMMVIGTNLALSLGMVGALSIIRFRTAIKDPKDIGFLFWGIGAGLSAGTGSYLIALTASIIIAIILFIFDKTSVDIDPYLLVIKGGKINEELLRKIVKKNTRKHNLKMRSVNQQGTEIIYEVIFQEGEEDRMIQNIQDLENISAINVVSHKGEIPG